jgi:hypothetical protein
MKNISKRITFVFGAGCLGGLVSGFALWLAGRYGLTASLGVKMNPVLSEGWLYHNIIRGGMLGFIFLLPVAKNSVVKRGLLISLAPTIVMLFIIFPYYTSEGMMGMGMGALTPLVIALYYAVWGNVTAIWLKTLRD